MDLVLPQQTYQSRSKPFSSERLLNMLFEPAGPSGKYMLIGTPGLKEYYNFGGSNPILGMIYIRDCLVYVTSAGIYVVSRDESGTVRQIISKTWGSLGVAKIPTSPVQMESNGDMVVLLNSENGRLYYVELSGDDRYSSNSWAINQCEVISNNTFYTSIAYISGVFVATCQIAGLSYVQFTDVLSHNFHYAFQLDTALSNLSAIKGNMRELWAFGANSIEVLAPTGEAGDYFFAHVAGAYINKGSVYKNSIVAHESTFFFYGTDGNIYMSNNYNMQTISTPALLDMIKSWGSLEYDQRDEIIGQIFTQRGHSFYVLKFLPFNKTLMFDLTTGSWLERESGNGEDWEGQYITRRPTGEMIVSSRSKTMLYYMDNDFYTDNGETIRREFVFATISAEGKKRMYFQSLTLEIDTGLGPNDSVMLSWSNDGGYTWGPERMVKLGDYGEYNKKIQFRRLGSGITRTFRVRLSTASMINVLRASIEYEVGQV